MFHQSQLYRPSKYFSEQFYALPDLSKTEAKLSFSLPDKPQDLKKSLDDATVEGKAFKQGMRAIFKEIKDWAKQQGIDASALSEFEKKYLDYSGSDVEVNKTNFPLYQQGFRALANIALLLKNDKLPLDGRKDALRNMFAGFAVCGPGAYTNITDANLELASYVSLDNKFLNWRRKVAEQKVLELIKPWGIRKGMEIHWVNAVLNTYADALGIPVIEDAYIVMCDRNVLDKLKQNFEEKMYFSVATFIDSLTDELYDDFSSKSLGRGGDYANAIKQIESVLAVYGVEPSIGSTYTREAIISFDESNDDLPFPSWKAKDILALSILRRLQASGFITDSPIKTIKLNNTTDFIFNHLQYVAAITSPVKKEIPLEVYIVETLAGTDQTKINELLALFRSGQLRKHVLSRFSLSLNNYLLAKEFSQLDTETQKRIHKQFMAAQLIIADMPSLLAQYEIADAETKQLFLSSKEFVSQVQRQYDDFSKLYKVKKENRLGILIALGKVNKQFIISYGYYVDTLDMLPDKDKILYRQFIRKMAATEPKLAEIIHADEKAKQALAKIKSKKELIAFAKLVRRYADKSEILALFARKVRMLDFKFDAELAVILKLHNKHHPEMFDILIEDLVDKAKTSGDITKLIKLNRRYSSSKTMPLIAKKLAEHSLKGPKLDLAYLVKKSREEDKKLLLDCYQKNPQAFNKLNWEGLVKLLPLIPEDQRVDFIVKNRLQDMHDKTQPARSCRIILEYLPSDRRLKFFKILGDEYKTAIARELVKKQRAYYREDFFCGQNPTFNREDLIDVWHDLQKANPSYNYVNFLIDELIHTIDGKKFIDAFLPQIKQSTNNYYNKLFEINSKLFPRARIVQYYLLDQYTNSELYSIFMNSVPIGMTMIDAIKWFGNYNKFSSIVIIRAVLGNFEQQADTTTARQSRLFKSPAVMPRLKQAAEILIDAIKNDNPVDIVEFNKKNSDIFTSSPLNDIYQWFIKPYEAQLQVQAKP